MNRMNKTDDIRINGIDELLPPIAHLYELPLDDKAAELVESTRNQIADLIHGRDKRLLAVIGPCSIHDPKAALEYARRLLPLRQKYEKELLIVMRVYFENRVPPSAGKASSTTPIWTAPSTSTSACAKPAACCWT